MQEHVQVESSKCKACRRCEIACIASHHGLDFKTAMKQKALYSPRCWAIKGDDFKTSVRCHCCDPAPCCNICPTGALHQNPDGTFSIHPELCAGCMMCASVCPYGVISPEVIGRQQEENAENLPATPARTIAIRCDLCHDWRLEKGVEYTACMEACLSQALSLVKKDGTIVQAPKPEKKPAAKASVAEAAKPEAQEEKKKSAEPVVEPTPEPKEEAQPAPAVAAASSQPQPEAKDEPTPTAQSNGDKQDKKNRKGKKKK
ncbi:MAG: 4Fe-4S binding protein [Desulfovibrio sp.]|nr:4Fe-4S binding protein [Desulfovibrio sp.]